MRSKPQFWFVLSLLLFAGAIGVWRYGNKYAAAHAPAGQTGHVVTSPQHPPLTKAMATNGVAKAKSYRISNTSQPIAKLLHNNHALILRNAFIDTEIPVALKIPEHLRAKGAPGSYLVQSDRPLDPHFYAELTKAGAAYVSYIPNNAALVKASPEQATNLAANADIVAVLPYEPYYKLDATLLPSAVDQQPTDQTNLSITTFAGQRDAALAALTKLGAKLIGEDQGPFGPTLVVSVPSESLAAVAQLPLAQEIEAYSPRRALNDLSRVQLGVSTDTLLGTPDYLGLSGKNVIVSLNDTGVDSTHPDLGPVSRLLGNPGALNDGDGHGTHVAGIIAGNGAESLTVGSPIPGTLPNADFRGKATNASLYVQTLDFGFGPFISDFSLQWHAAANLGSTNLISNNSWGYNSQVYDSHAASFDAATRDARPDVTGEQPLLFVFAAGNSGNGRDDGTSGQADTIVSPGTAKNVITVGAVDSPRFITNLVSYDGVTTNEVFYDGTSSSNLLAWFSSCGNVGLGLEGTYGRFKPDVVAPGVFTISCRSIDYVDPTNETFLSVTPYPNQTVKLNQTNSDYAVFLPDDTEVVVVVVSSNAASPIPFPTNMEILADTFSPPTDIVSSNNFYVLTNFNPGDVWFFGVTPPTNQPQPVAYDFTIYLYETNSEGDYFTVLSNMNKVLFPKYRYESGTSMSAAAVSGTLALMQEYLQKNTTFTNPSPALLKAMLINGSRSLGLQYDFAVNTQGVNEQGWGMPNLTNCVPMSFTNPNPSLVLYDQSPTNALATGQYQTYQIQCSDTNASLVYPLRVTLVWTDPPGNPNAGVALVNNLNLTVTDVNGSNVYIGNDFQGGDIFTEVRNPTNLPPGESDNAVQNIYINQGVSNFTAAGDSINNVQNVYINPTNAPIAFPLTVTVSGTRVNVNAVPGQTNDITQDYVLVISSDDPALGSALTVTRGPITNAAPVLVTVASNAVPLLHQRVGANEPNLYMSNNTPALTNGNISQWHFFVFTNDQFTNGTATNVAFATFLPPNLSIPRNTDADIDMYVSTDPTLTNLNPAALLAADKSLTRTGTESIIYSNSVANRVYYIGVKSEDQQAADFGFYGIAQEAPFSSTSADGNSLTATGTSLPVFIPNALSPTPALAFAFMVNPNPVSREIRRVTVTLAIDDGAPGALFGSLQHSGLDMVLNSFSSPTIGPGFTNTFDDLQEDPTSGDITSIGPGSLTQYVGQNADGLWLLSEANNDQTLTGSINNYLVTVDLHQLALSGFFITLGAGEWFDDYVLVPNDATNMIVYALYQNNGTNLAGVGPIGIYLTNDVGPITTSDFGSNGINPPGGSLTLGTNYPVPGWPNNVPPLSGGLWYYGIHNEGTAPVSLFVKIVIQETLTPNLVQNYTNDTPISLTTDGHTQSTICIDNGQQLVDMQLGLRLDDTNLDDLVVQLTSPQGTRVVLFENRGGTNAMGLGLSYTNTNGLTNVVYTVFTENTNLTTTPIKFAPPPYAFSNFVAGGVIVSNSFETNLPGVYTNDNTNVVILDGWQVTNNVVTIQTTNGLTLLTNNEVGIVSDPTNNAMFTNIGTNYLALTSGRIIQTYSNLMPNAEYQIQYYARGPGIQDWWPGEMDAADLIGTNNGTFPLTNIMFDAGEVGRAFTFSGASAGNEIDFGTNVGNFGSNDFTVDFWIKQPAGLTGLYSVMEKRNSCDANTSFLDIHIGHDTVFPASTDGQIFFDFSGDAVFGYSTAISNKKINDGFYHHVAMIRNGLSLSVYVDGALDSTPATTHVGTPIPPIQNSNVFRFGRSVCEGGFGDGSLPFLGDLDEVDIFNRALSPAEVFGIYHAGSIGKYDTNSILPNFDLTIDGISTNNIVLTNEDGGWQLFTNTFVATNGLVTVEFAGNALGVLLDDIQLIQLPTTNYNNYFLPEEPLTPFVGQNPKGCWTLDIWDTRLDSPLPINGTLLSWTMQLTTSSTNAVLDILTNRIPMTVTNTNSGMTYFAVDVPSYSKFATNILTVTANGPLTLYFNQTQLPTGGLPGDVVLAGGVTVATPSTTVLSSQGAPPPLQPGQRYFLGVLNNNPNAIYTIEVDFDGSTNLIIPLTNTIAFTNIVGTNVSGTNGPQFYSFLVPTNAALVTFQILDPTNGEVDLYASDSLPLPSPVNFAYESRNTASNDQFIVVTTNSVPVALPVFTTNDVFPLTPTTWYLGAYNFAGVSNVGYTIVATVVTTNTGIQIIQLTNGVPYLNTNAPGYPTNVLYSYVMTNTNAAGLQFTVTNLSTNGNAELLASWDVIPTPSDFYVGSFNPGTNAQLIQIGTNSTVTNLNGTWYLAVPNNSPTNVSYAIEALELAGPGVVNTPLITSAMISPTNGGFSMTWVAIPGKTYEVDMATNLLHWGFVTNVVPATTSGFYNDPTPVKSQHARFYRLIRH